MIDIKLIRDDPKEIEALLKTKEPAIDLAPILTLDARVRELKVEGEELKAKRNALSKQVGELKRKGEDASSVMEEVGGIGDRIGLLDEELKTHEAELEQALAVLPNLPMKDVKVSLDPADNVCLKVHLEKPEFGFKPKNHLELNEQLGLFDFKRGAKVAGTGWPTYRGIGAQLEWALLRYMLDTHIENGYEMWMPPLCVREEMMFGVGQFPKFADQVYKLEDDLYLIPTAEAALNGLFHEEILEEEELPQRLCSYTPCFRREAGAAGSQERGLIRIHQFNKVEMFCLTKPEESGPMFEEMVASAEQILQGLEIHYRNMLLVTGDMSFPSSRTIDLEVWLPGQERYYEVSSVSNCTDFQARRSKIRFRRKGEKPELLHTLNGSGVATSRLMVALLENNQQEDGSVLIPKVLQKYLGGLEVLR